MNPSLFLAIQTSAEAVEPWFDPQTFGAYAGGFGGAGVGLLGAFFGGFGSWAARRGKFRGLVLGGMGVSGLLCVLSLAAGLVAVASGQPYAIWYPFTLIGAIGSGCFLGLLPVMRKRYTEAENRRFEAAGIRSQAPR